MELIGQLPDQVRIPPGWYDVMLIDVSEYRDDATQTVVSLTWTFLIDTGGTELHVRLTTTTDLAPYDDATEIVEALLGRPVKPGEIIADGDLLGRSCVAYVSRTTDLTGRLSYHVWDFKAGEVRWLNPQAGLRRQEGEPWSG